VLSNRLFVRKAHDRIGIADVNLLWIRAGRGKVYSKRTLKPRREHLCVLGLAVRGDAAENANFSGAAFGNEKITVGSGAYQARLIEAGGVQLNFESGIRQALAATRFRGAAQVEGYSLLTVWQKQRADRRA
jgi:hypothetical protein